MNYPVDNLDDAYNACNPDKPLEVGDSRYLDLKEVRNNRLVHEYENGKSWAALHPALGEIGWLQTKLTENPAP